MNFALQNTLELLLIIGLGLLLQKKIAKQDLKGVKTIILSVALPAVIFVALLKIKLESSLLVFPLLALSFNLIMLLASKYFLSASLPKKENSKKRTAMMLLPSFIGSRVILFPFYSSLSRRRFFSTGRLGRCWQQNFRPYSSIHAGHALVSLASGQKP